MREASVREVACRNGVASAGMSVGQLVIIAILAAVLVGIGWRSVFVWVGLAHLLFLPLILPFIALVIGASALGEERDDGTILYLASTPLPRLAIALSFMQAMSRGSATATSR